MSRRPQIAVIGASSAPAEAIALAEQLGAALVQAGCRVVCGGRDGVMAAVCRGARTAPGWWDGATIGILPGDSHAGANAWVDVILPTGLGLARNTLVVQAADAVVMVSGAAGTLSEAALAWQLGKPICALHSSGGWSERLAGESLDHRQRPPIHRAETPDDVVAWLAETLDLTAMAPTDDAPHA